MENRHYGGFWRRLLAFVIDKTIIYALSLNVSLIALLIVGLGGDIMTLLHSSTEEITGKIGALTTLCVFLSFIIDMAYFTWFHGVNGQTPGKMLLRLRVIAASGEPITPGTAFLRWTGYLISGLFFFLGFFWIAIDRRKQGWHDKIALTLVVPVVKSAGAQTNKPSTEKSQSLAMTDSTQNTHPTSSLPLPGEMTTLDPPSYDQPADVYPPMTKSSFDPKTGGEKGLDKQSEIL
jgi:uncharacterized RDD family membrane protein YckC